MIPIGDTRRRFGFPWMTTLLLAICLVLFLYERRVPLHLSGLSVKPWELVAGQHLLLLRLAITSMLVQGPGLLEPIVNLVYLWVLGSKVEDACGPWGLLSIALLSAVSGVAVRMIVDPIRFGPYEEQPIYGLVGVIAGLFGAYIVIYAFRPIPAWLPPIVARLTPVPVFLHLLYWGGLEFVNIDFGLLRSGKVLQSVSFESMWPMVGVLIVGLLVGQLFVRREYLWLRLLQARKAAAARR
jgi:membrane associated rhomboid family serine protease